MVFLKTIVESQQGSATAADVLMGGRVGVTEVEQGDGELMEKEM